MPVEPALLRFGRTQVRVLRVDGLAPGAAAGRLLAAARAPFPAAPGNYPGLRRMIGESDAEAFSYVTALLQAAAPYLAGAFDFDRFRLVEASFSVVTTRPADLAGVQRAPHFDQPDPDLYAVLQYLSETEGTAFFRHEPTGIELVDAAMLGGYVAAARQTVPPPGYIDRSRNGYAMIGQVAGRIGRVVAYPARALHSGIIPPGFVAASDPRLGRLTTNIFIRAER